MSKYMSRIYGEKAIKGGHHYEPMPVCDKDIANICLNCPYDDCIAGCEGSCNYFKEKKKELAAQGKNIDKRYI